MPIKSRKSISAARSCLAALTTFASVTAKASWQCRGAASGSHLSGEPSRESSPRGTWPTTSKQSAASSATRGTPTETSRPRLSARKRMLPIS